MSYAPAKEFTHLRDDEVPRHRSNKDTKRWCLGRPGREHVKVWQEARRCAYYRRPEGLVVSALACVNCRKEFQELWQRYGEYDPVLRRHAATLGPAF